MAPRPVYAECETGLRKMPDECGNLGEDRGIGYGKNWRYLGIVCEGFGDEFEDRRGVSRRW